MLSIKYTFFIWVKMLLSIFLKPPDLNDTKIIFEEKRSKSRSGRLPGFLEKKATSFSNTPYGKSSKWRSKLIELIKRGSQDWKKWCCWLKVGNDLWKLRTEFKCWSKLSPTSCRQHMSSPTLSMLHWSPTSMIRTDNQGRRSGELSWL